MTDHPGHISDQDRFELPFEPRRRDWAEWIYDHRTGLLVTVGVYLLLGIGVAASRISLERSAPVSAFFVEMENLQELIEQKERLEQQVREEQLLRQMEQEYEAIRNRASNAEGELDAGLRDAQGTNASQIYDQAADVQARLNASRDAYERGLQSASDILNNRPTDARGETNADRTNRQRGRVTVTYYFPSGRSHRNLPVPSYQCEGGGTVVVNVEANAGGRIIKASASRGADPCLKDYAERAALRSQFYTGAQEAGTITYEFVAQ